MIYSRPIDVLACSNHDSHTYHFDYTKKIRSGPIATDMTIPQLLPSELIEHRLTASVVSSSSLKDIRKTAAGPKYPTIATSSFKQTIVDASVAYRPYTWRHCRWSGWGGGPRQAQLPFRHQKTIDNWCPKHGRTFLFFCPRLLPTPVTLGIIYRHELHQMHAPAQRASL